MSHFDADQQTELIRLLAQRVPTPICPACGGPCAVIESPPRRDVSYVRKRVVVRCSSCLKSLGLEAYQIEGLLVDRTPDG